MIRVEKELFGIFKDFEVYKYKIKNDNGFQVNAINYGGTITEIYVKDKNGKLKNVVLGYKSLEKYIESNAYPGMIIGRTAGRIENSKFEIDGITYKLDKNNGENNIHGGFVGFNNKVFNVEIFESGVEFNYESPRLEGGYPGNIKIKIKYTLTNDNSLVIEYEGISDKKTYVNLTNHSYFNLSGNLDENGDEQVLTIKSDNICELKEGIIPTGKLLKVKDEENSIFDFVKGKKIKEGIEKGQSEGNYQFKITRAYDHPFKLNWSEIKNEPQIILKSLYSGIKMDVFTTEKIAVLYTGNFLDEVEVFDNENNKRNQNKRYLGIAIETQDYPNGVNIRDFDSKILEKGEKYYSKTIFKFSNF